MARLIDADELLESIEETTWYHVFKGKLIHGANSKTDIPLYKASDIYSVLDAAPTIDAVQVVRCKDCAHYDNGICWNGYITGNCDCDLEKDPNGYCDWGEPKDGE